MVRSGSISMVGEELGMVEIVGGADGRSVGVAVGMWEMVGASEGLSVG